MFGGSVHEGREYLINALVKEKNVQIRNVYEVSTRTASSFFYLVHICHLKIMQLHLKRVLQLQYELVNRIRQVPHIWIHPDDRKDDQKNLLEIHQVESPFPHTSLSCQSSSI